MTAIRSMLDGGLVVATGNPDEFLGLDGGNQTLTKHDLLERRTGHRNSVSHFDLPHFGIAAGNDPTPNNRPRFDHSEHLPRHDFARADHFDSGYVLLK